MTHSTDRWDKGPFLARSPGEGRLLEQPWDSGTRLRIRISPGDLSTNHLGSGELEVPSGKSTQPRVELASDLIFYGVEGRGTLHSGKSSWPIGPDTTIWLPFGTPYSIEASDNTLQLFWIATPHGYETSYERTENVSTLEEAISRTAPNTARILTQNEFESYDNSDRVVVLSADEGPSFWQPDPTRGYAAPILTPALTHRPGFSMGLQVVGANGGLLIPHAHARSEEMLLILKGRGQATLNGHSLQVEPGSLIFAGRWVSHGLESVGPEDLWVLWFITPGEGLEHMLEGFGRPRKAGESEPAPFPYPPTTGDLLEEFGQATPRRQALQPEAPPATYRG